jgi:hypothetical protein
MASILDIGKGILRFGRQAKPTADDAVNAVTRTSLGQRFKNLPWYIRYGIPTVAAVGGAGKLYQTLTGTPDVEADYGTFTPPSLGGGSNDAYADAIRLLEEDSAKRREALDKWYEQARQQGGNRAGLDSYISGLGGFGSSQERALAREYGDVMSAADARARFAQTLGQAGARDVTGIYGNRAQATQAAAQANTLGSATAGLTPVSGELAVAPQRMQEAGSALADYILNTSGIASRDALASATSLQKEQVNRAGALRNAISMAQLAAERKYQEDRARENASLRSQYERMILEMESGAQNRMLEARLQQAAAAAKRPRARTVNELGPTEYNSYRTAAKAALDNTDQAAILKNRYGITTVDQYINAILAEEARNQTGE